MKLEIEIKKIEMFLEGSKTTESEVQLLVEKLSPELISPWFLSMIQKFKLAGVCFSLNEDEDLSGMGAELKWLTVGQLIEEAMLVYPGISVLSLGYLPIGMCLFGSGDPYFLKLLNCKVEDPPLVRVPHDCVLNDQVFPEEKIETVCESLSHFFCKANIDS